MLNLLRHLFTPHHTNNHRPKALHLGPFIFYILFYVLLQINLTSFTTIVPEVLGYATDINVEKLLVLTNQKRSEDGLGPLVLNPQLSQAAAGKAEDMLKKNYWSHNAPDGTTPWVFIRGVGYDYYYAGENLAKNFSNSEGVVNAWMASPTHRENMLKPEYQDIGFAVANGRLSGEETTLVVEIFGAKQKAEIAALPPSPISPTPKVSLASPTPSPAGQMVLPVEEKSASLVASLRRRPAIPAFVQNSPSVNIFSLTKSTSLFLIGFLMFVLFIDAFLIWRRKTVRVSGHNFAHFFFLLMTTGAIWFIKQGGVR